MTHEATTAATNPRYDVVVIGGGAAGLSAALVLARARRSVLVVDAGRPRNAPAARMHGYLSRDGMPPADLIAAGRVEVASYGGELRDDEVTRVARVDDRHFDVQLRGGDAVRARRVLVTTGLTDQVPDLPGLAERWGRDLLHCPYCHGHEVRDQPLGVLGGTAGSATLALLLRQWSPDVVLFTHTTVLTDEQREQLTARAVGVVDGPVAGLVVEQDRLSGVRLEDGRQVRRAAVFVRPDFVTSTRIVADLGGQTDHEGWPLVDPTGRTTAAGVWAAGNAVNPRAQVITAAGEGSAAAIAINNDLTEEDVRAAVVDFRAGRPA